MSNIFVIMPFGNKGVITSGRIIDIDFDNVYRNLILPSCQLAGHIAKRIDEVDFTGVIGVELIRHLFSAEIVLADLTGGNANVFFELGIRQALTERPTILIANRNTSLPFDIHDQRLFYYDVSDTADISVNVRDLSDFISKVDQAGARSPILARLRELGLQTDPARRSEFEADLRQKISRAVSLEQLTALWHWCSDKSPLPPYLLLDLADKIAHLDGWALATEIGQRAAVEKPDDFEIHRRIGWYQRNIGPSEYSSAERQFRRALELNPADPETLGMLGGLMKRLNRFGEASALYDAGYRLCPSSTYMRVARAAMRLLHELSEGREPSDGIVAYRELYEALVPTWRDRGDPWDMAVLGECAFVLGSQQQAVEFFNAAFKASTKPTILESPADQIELFSSFGFRQDTASETVELLRRQAKKTEVVQIVDDSTTALKTITMDGAGPIIVHLSDIHFGSRLDENGEQISMHRFGTGDYSQTLIDHMETELASVNGRFSLIGKPAIVVASGDFVYTATDKEFVEALAFFQALRNITNLSSERFVFCPGNHDVDWALSAVDIHKRFDNYLSFLRKFYGNELLAKLYPLIKWDFSFDGIRPMPDDLVSVVYHKEQSVFFASYNSCVYETEQHHYGYISLRQQQKMAKLIEKSEISSGAIRIAVVHHHIHPYPEFFEVKNDLGHWIDLSTIRDGGLFERFLERHAFDIVLHGHKHQAQLRETLLRDRAAEKDLKPLIVCGAGSCGVSSQELAHSTGNQYQVISFIGRPRTAGADFIRVEWRELSLDPAAEWATTKMWNVRGG